MAKLTNNVGIYVVILKVQTLEFFKEAFVSFIDNTLQNFFIFLNLHGANCLYHHYELIQNLVCFDEWNPFWAFITFFQNSIIDQ